MNEFIQLLKAGVTSMCKEDIARRYHTLLNTEVKDIRYFLIHDRELTRERLEILFRLLVRSSYYFLYIYLSAMQYLTFLQFYDYRMWPKSKKSEVYIPSKKPSSQGEDMVGPVDYFNTAQILTRLTVAQTNELYRKLWEGNVIKGMSKKTRMELLQHAQNFKPPVIITASAPSISDNRGDEDGVHDAGNDDGTNDDETSVELPINRQLTFEESDQIVSSKDGANKQTNAKKSVRINSQNNETREFTIEANHRLRHYNYASEKGSALASQGNRGPGTTASHPLY
jgi:hypothetical protein